MKRFGLIGVTLVVAGGLLVSVAAADRPETAPKIIAGNAYGKVRPRNARPIAGGVSPQLIGHGGAVMNLGASVTSVFWGSAWSDSGYVGDKVEGLASFYGGLDGSSYMKTNTEYSGSNGKVGSAVVYNGAVFDSSATPSRKAPTTTEVLAAVARTIKNPVSNGYYPVYTDIPRGHNGYCAWHSYGTINGVPVQFGFFFDLANDPGCDPGGDLLGHSPPLAALANVSGHEISEAVTDPRNGGWWDSSGAENADKCAWTFHTTVALTNDSQWRIQGNWSNNAYSAGAGYAKVGCIDGN